MYTFLMQLPRPLKYIGAGSISTGVSLGVLYILTEWSDVWYLLSASIAFIIGFFVSFTLQKFWTFQNTKTDELASQGGFYFLIVLGNLGLNTLGMYILVDLFQVWYLGAEVGMLVLIACESYFLYRVVFERSSLTDSATELKPL